MTSRELIRVSGLVLLIGAVTFIAHIVARSVLTATAGGDTVAAATQSSWVPINALGALGAALVFLGLPGLYVGIADAVGRLALVGVVLFALGWMIVGLFLSLYSLLVLPWLAVHAPSVVDAINQDPLLLIVFASGLIAELVGIVLVAIPFVRGRLQPRWMGYLLSGSAVMVIVGDLVAPTGPAANLAVNLLSNLGPVLLVLALAVLGLRMWREQPRIPQRPSVQHQSAARATVAR
jgi:hypothetical protein